MTQKSKTKGITLGAIIRQFTHDLTSDDPTEEVGKTAKFVGGRIKSAVHEQTAGALREDDEQVDDEAIDTEGSVA